MKVKVGLVWDEPTLFGRYLEDCGLSCESVTPHMLAAPFWRASLSLLIVPTGFGSARFSRLLPALRASAARIRRFLTAGGCLLVFGAADPKSDLYDWLPFSLEYYHQYGECALTIDLSHPCAGLVTGFDPACIPCDGYFTRYEGEVVASNGEHAVIVACQCGEGTVVATTVHEYPSRAFLATFPSLPREVLL
ncbi:MAG: hypothetical protein NT074_04215 [Methanomicrobiales archaeon]|nr:hypothetical protein [Methanomicrobiales archaeon]